MSKMPGLTARNHLGVRVASLSIAMTGTLAASIAAAAIPLGEGCISRLLALSENRIRPVIMYACEIGKGKTRFWCESDLGTPRHGEASSLQMCLEPKELFANEPYGAKDISVSLPNGAHYQGHGTYGVPNGKGKWIWSSPAGDKIEQTGYWVNGRRAGEFTIYRNGQLAEITLFVDDRRNGRSTIYTNGRPTMSGSYLEDKREGDWTVIDSRDARPLAVRTYAGGNLLRERLLKAGAPPTSAPGTSTSRSGAKAHP